MNIPTELQPTSMIEVKLPDGQSTLLPVCNPVFQKWTGVPVGFDYGKKPLLDYKGKPCLTVGP